MQQAHLELYCAMGLLEALPARAPAAFSLAAAAWLSTPPARGLVQDVGDVEGRCLPSSGLFWPCSRG